MSYKIVVDSCCELPSKYRKSDQFEIIPLGLGIDDYHIMDDETFDQADFIRRVAASPSCPRSACPSPDRYRQAYTCDADDIYVVTLSSHLSGSYNSALIGKDIYHEETGSKNIYVTDSKSASCGETQIAYKLKELADSGLPFEEVISQINLYRDSMKTFFVLDNLDALRKNGRLSRSKALIATTLNIKPVCCGVDGDIQQCAQGHGIKKAIIKMISIIEKDVKDPEDRTLMVSHCNCFERGMLVKDMIMSRVPFKDFVVLDMAGVSTLYAGNGGIIVTY